MPTLDNGTIQRVKPQPSPRHTRNADDAQVTSNNVLVPNNNALPVSWYPVMLSRQLKKRQVKLIDGFDGQWIIFRSEQGKAVAFSRYCCHMGVDLLCAKVNGDKLVCPMHEWHFADNGACVQIPCDEDIPKSARQDTLPCVERYGVIFVYWGKEQDIEFDIPNYPELIEPMVDRSYCRIAPTPFLSIMLNAFDVHHMKHVHHREVIGKPLISKLGRCHMSIDMTTRVLLKSWNDYLTRLLGFKQASIRFDCWGGNLIVVSNYSAKFRVLIALAPHDENSCKVYFIGAMEQHGANFAQRALLRMRLKATGFLGREFLKLDLPVFTGMQAKPGVLLKEADTYAIKFWQHWKQLPRGNASDITVNNIKNLRSEKEAQ